MSAVGWCAGSIHNAVLWALFVYLHVVYFDVMFVGGDVGQRNFPSMWNML